MKRIIFLTLGSVFLTSLANAVPAGLYRAVDAYCTNPKYVFDADEKAFIDNLKGIGCGTGRIQDMPCFQDYYQFGPETGKGALINLSVERPGIACSITTQLTYTEKKTGFLEGVLGEVTSAPVSNDPNVSISCGVKEQDGDGGSAKPPVDNSFFLSYRMDGANILVIQSEDDECGEYIFKLTPVKAVGN